MPLPAHAQDAGETQSVRAELQAERTKLVAANLQLTDAEAAKFWPLYNEYRAEHSKLGDRSLALVEDFAKNYDALSDEKAKDLLKRQFEIEDDRLKLRAPTPASSRRSCRPRRWRATTRSSASWTRPWHTRRRSRSPWQNDPGIQRLLAVA